MPVVPSVRVIMGDCYLEHFLDGIRGIGHLFVGGVLGGVMLVNMIQKAFKATGSSFVYGRYFLLQLLQCMASQ